MIAPPHHQEQKAGNIERDRVAANERLLRDYFGENPVVGPEVVTFKVNKVCRRGWGLNTNAHRFLLFKFYLYYEVSNNNL